MFTPDFFPNTPFAWVFTCVVVVLTAIAAYIDTKTAKIPNRLTVPILFIGIAFSLTRSVWQGAVEHPLFLFDTGTWWLGLLDGIAFVFIGFFVAFGLYFAFWIFSLVGAGDVKLMAALGPWFGVKGFFFLFVTTIVTMMFWSGFLVVYTRVTGTKSLMAAPTTTQPRKAKGKGNAPAPIRRGLTTFSVPVALATILSCLWMYRYDLQLTPRKLQPADQAGGTTDAPPKPN